MKIKDIEFYIKHKPDNVDKYNYLVAGLLICKWYEFKKTRIHKKAILELLETLNNENKKRETRRD